MVMDEINDPYELLLEMMRLDFAIFLRKAFPWVSGGDELEWNWHFDAIAHQLDRVANRQCRRLLVNLAPRNGKSIAISVAWVAWMLGRYPRHRFVCISYSNDLSYKLGRDCLAIMQSSWYRELFPRTILKRTAAHDIETTLGGGRLASSITGTLTGRGGDTIILDDVIKPAEANSEIVRANVNAWYQSTLSSRLNDKRKGAIICVMQRLHQYDLPGLLIETGRYDVLSLPAIAQEDQIIQLPRNRIRLFRRGDLLHPERESLETLEEQRADMGSDNFAAQYLQNPVPALGNLIKAHWFKTYDPALLKALGGIIVQSIDTANKAGPTCDFSVVVTAIVVGKLVYIIDVARFRSEFYELKQKVVALAREYRPHTILVEEAASGIGLISELRTVQDIVDPIPRKATIEKQMRIEGVSPMIEAGQLLLPPDAPYLSEFKAEMLAFPSGRFDDQVDAVAHLLDWVRQGYTYEPPTLAGPELMEYDSYGNAVWRGADGVRSYRGFNHNRFSDPWL
jgi:predicted phage terminase large subunit-like protein